MKRLLLIPAGGILYAAGIQMADSRAKTSAPTVDDRTAIEAVVAAYGDASNRRADGFAGDGPDGDAGARSRSTTDGDPAPPAGAVDEIEFLAPEVALVQASWTRPGFVAPSGGEIGNLRAVATVVLVKRDGRWRIRTIHENAADASPPAKAAIDG